MLEIWHILQYLTIRKEAFAMETRLTIPLSQELREVIRIAAATAGLSTAAWVRKILHDAAKTKAA